MTPVGSIRKMRLTEPVGSRLCPEARRLPVRSTAKSLRYPDVKVAMVPAESTLRTEEDFWLIPLTM